MNAGAGEASEAGSEMGNRSGKWRLGGGGTEDDSGYKSEAKKAMAALKAQIRLVERTLVEERRLLDESLPRPGADR